MESASDDLLINSTEMPVPVENGLPTKENDVAKLNGDTNSEESDSEQSSESATAATNTDCEGSLKRKLVTSPENGVRSFKKLKCDNDFVPPTNPYFSESLFELSGLHTNAAGDDDAAEQKNGIHKNASLQDVQDSEDTSKSSETSKSKKFPVKNKRLVNQKPREHTHLLGLQPAINFRCQKCGLRQIPSLTLLNEHYKSCTGKPVPNQQPDNSIKKLFVTRRNVFLCSACGCYFENYNLFLHIYKVHKRFVCLYCSAVFSNTDKFLFHLHTKHNCVPKHLTSEKDFFEEHKQPCYLMCCECEKIFGDGEEEHFYGHACNGAKSLKDAKNKIGKVLVNNHKTSNKGKPKSKTFVEHVTGDTDAPSILPAPEQFSDSSRLQSPEEIDVTNPNPSSPCTIAETDTTLVTMETDKKDSETNLSGSEDNPEIEQSHGNLDSDNENDQLVSEDDVDDNPGGSENTNIEETEKTEQQEEVRRVPKVTLKIPKRPPSVHEDEIGDAPEDTDDSDKLTMELDTNTECTDTNFEKDTLTSSEPTIIVAGVEIPVTELELEQPLDKFDIQILLQKCLQLTIPTCVYCNHARKIAVNGKQLGLHAIAEHRFSAVVNSITAEELIPESFVMRIKESLPELQDVYFSLDESQSEDRLPLLHVFECFQCRFSTTLHKELYLHNRKMHAKSILLCIMCKSNFASYSELTCHMCPGLYDQDKDITYRCSFCDAEDLPSAFRLMVHLRKRHNACDVCLELCHNQSRLSNHVWKHKLHHSCYRCGIAYRNKPDITKHLFWKHGTESVLCKKCLQKKWPHMYHFCTPPSTFTCEECNLNFTKAIALKVHKRLHNNEKPHACTFENCTETFISKKLLLKHEFKHREPVEKEVRLDSVIDEGDIDVSTITEDETVSEPAKDESKLKPKVDVLEDLPALNLSESDSSDSEDETKQTTKPSTPTAEDNLLSQNIETPAIAEDPVPILENIWDDFKIYQAQKEKPSSIETLVSKESPVEAMEVDMEIEENLPTSEVDVRRDQKQIVQLIMQDHDYSLLSQAYKNDPHAEVSEEPRSVDHDYCTQKDQAQSEPIVEQMSIQSPIKEETKPETLAASSNDSDSSSCSCGPDCSCSSGSSSSSSDSSDSDSSTSEGRRKQQLRREQRRQRTKIKKESETSHIDVVATDCNHTTAAPVELIIEETDLETTESETDEEFYDKQPHKVAYKLLAEKRKELMIAADLGTLVNGSTSRPSTPNLQEPEAVEPKPKKSKSKKKKKKNRKRERAKLHVPSTVYQYPTVSPLSISLPKNSPLSISTPSLMTPPILSTLGSADFNSDASNVSDTLRASKRRRVPNKFYGYSSDEEQEKQEKMEKHGPPVLKWRKADLPSPVQPPLLVPPITLKAIPTPPVEEPDPVQSSFHHPHPALFKQKVHDATESNDSTSEDEQIMPTMNKPLNQPPLYCYCRCPYDEVSEMIGCDADDCLIEWFHFECVGIMVPPKGQWFCPDCRKKRQQRRELAQL